MFKLEILFYIGNTNNFLIKNEFLSTHANIYINRLEKPKLTVLLKNKTTKTQLWVRKNPRNPKHRFFGPFLFLGFPFQFTIPICKDNFEEDLKRKNIGHANFPLTNSPSQTFW